MNRPIHAYLLLSIAVFFWGGNVIIARSLHENISAIALSSGRWFLATLLVLPFALPYMKREWHLVRQNWKLIALLGLLGVSAFNTLLYEATHTTASINISLIQTTMPAMIVLIVFVLFKEPVSMRALSGVLISISGAMLVVSRGDWQMFSSWDFVRGDLIMLLANFIYGLYSVLIKKLPAMHALTFIGSSFIFGCLFLVPLILFDLTVNPLPALDQQLALSLIYVAIFPSIASYLAWNRGVQIIGPSMAGFFICLIPVFTAILGSVFLKEALHWYHYTGMLIILIGFMLFQRQPRH